MSWRVVRDFQVACATTAVMLLAVGLSHAQDRFPFVIPGDDASASFTDLSHLSPRPAGADGFVQVKDGHFATTGGRLKIWGVNTCFGGNFPSQKDAEIAAAHLAKLGVNGVRMHHHDNRTAPAGLWGPVVDGRRQFDPRQLDRQDYFLDQLHRNGIYANLNLHVSRTFTEAEGFVSAGLPREVRYNKYLLYFEPRMRERFKEFCRKYLTHFNPYRRLRRVDDPGISMIEITNENAFNTRGPEIARNLPPPYRDEFRQQWNRWLLAKYDTTVAIEKAWSVRNEPLRPSLVDSRVWSKGLGSWRVRESDGHPVRAEVARPGPKPDSHALRLALSTVAPQIHFQELQYPDVPLERGKPYTLSFWIRADGPRTLYFDVSNQGPADWSNVGIGEHLRIGPEWKHVQRVIRAGENLTDKARLCFKFGGSDINFELSDVRIQPGAEWITVPAGQSIESGTVDIPTAGWSEIALSDTRQFMVEIETEFIREIIEFLKKDLGVRVPITASQIDYHGAAIVAETCDYADIHSYWQHPRFPRRPWDPVDWTIGNKPMEAHPDADALLSRAPWRLADRPFTLSEWNIPDPIDYAASVVPFAATIAALQDWDAVFFFQYHSREDDWRTDHVQRYFSFNGQPVKLALLTACANLFRRGDLRPLQNVELGSADRRLPAALGFRSRIGIHPSAQLARQVAAPDDVKRLETPRGDVLWDALRPDRAFVRVVTPATCAVWGLIGENDHQLGDIGISVHQVDRNYAAIVLTSMDGQPLEVSKRILLTAVGSAENTGMKWNADRTSVGNRWGDGPAQVNGIAATIKLPFPIKTVKAIDGRGRPQDVIAVKRNGDSAMFAIGPQYHTLWYAIER